MGYMLSRLSSMLPAISGSFNFEISLPQLPTVGFITAGYPCLSSARSAASCEKATLARGVGTPAFFSSMCAYSLLPASTPVLWQFIISTPIPSSAAVEWTLL